MMARRRVTFVCATVASVLLCGGASASVSPTITFSPSQITIGSYRIWSRAPLPTYGRAIRAFGTASSCVLRRGQTNDATVKWVRKGITAEFTTLGVPPNGGDACSEPAAYQLDHLIVSSRSWRTAEGLRVGDPSSRIAALYPHALPHGSTWWIIVRKNVIGSSSLYPLVSATVRSGKIASLVFLIRAEGD